jgi:hypothetical protein
MNRISQITRTNAISRWSFYSRLAALTLTVFSLFSPGLAYSADTVCARVKIEIKQELTLERQAFDATMKINNGLDTSSLTNVAVNVKFTDEFGNAVKATSDPNDTSASFYIRIDTMTGISNVSGTGSVAPASTAEIHWLIIPAPGAGGTVPSGKLYLVGATLNYSLGGDPQTVEVIPDSIYVKPLPLLTLDYFLTQYVYADDPFTAAIEPAEPFTLGVRIKNTGAAPAQNVKIDSAQPKIVDNSQGLLINFLITGSYVNDLPASNSMLIPFGNIATNTAATGRWIMLTTLSGKFVDFKATFTHADSLGGTLTSILQATNAHLLVRDVKVDLPGRDNVRDFLALDGNTLRVYESDNIDTIVTDQSAASSLVTSSTGYSLSAPPTQGFMYVKLSDPYAGTKVIGPVVRADGKVLLTENAWLSKEKNSSNAWVYYINFFDVNNPAGGYKLSLNDQANTPKPPVLQFVPDKIVNEGQQVSFLVQASGQNGAVPTLTSSVLPTGAKFTQQSAANSLVTSVFDWTPAVGQAGKYSITFSAADGDLSAAQTMTITVQTATKPGGPGTPLIMAPAVGTDVLTLQPIMQVGVPSSLDLATSYQFEVYSDAGLSQLVIANTNVARAGDSTTWKVPQLLKDNSSYYWRVRAFDGTTYSEWANGRFFVNPANDPPGPVSIVSPASGSEVTTLTPTLVVANAVDPEGDTVTYGFQLYSNSALTTLLATTTGLAAGANSATSWAPAVTLTDKARYYWRAIATDAHGAQTQSIVANFLVNIGNHAPSSPVIMTPMPGTTVTTTSVPMTVSNSIDVDNDPITYNFELDKVNTFNSPAKIGSGTLLPGQNNLTSWTATSLVEDTHYYWRVKASDGKTNTDWVTGDFLVNALNNPPSVPVLKNPGDQTWINTLQPKLEVGPATDPEGDAISYHFEVYQDAALASRVVDNTLTQTQWLTPALNNNKDYYWRAQAIDALGAASAFSAPAKFTVAVATQAKPTITVITPALIQASTGNTFSINWEVIDPANNASVTLYVDTSNSGAAGQLIVANLKQDPSTTTGSYVWDISNLAPGTYYVYAVVSNGYASDLKYAPGALVIPAANPKGSITVTPTTILTTSESGINATFQVVLNNPPTADVVIGLSSTNVNEGTVTPTSFTFTQSNWSIPQNATVKGIDDCVLDGNVQYQIITAKAVSTDPNYMGVKGADLTYTNLDNDLATTNSSFAVCNFTKISEVRINLYLYDYTFTAQLTNLGADVGGATGTLKSTSPYTVVQDGTLIFGPVTSGGTVTSQDTFTIRQDRRYPFSTTSLIWTIVPK